MSRILAIDYGKKRTGIAVTDPLCIIANGLATVSTSELFEFLSQYITKESVGQIVIGKPIQPNGQPSENLARVENFVNRWRKLHPEMPIDKVAFDWLVEAGVPLQIVVTKADKLNAKEKSINLAKIKSMYPTDTPPILYSSLKHTGRELLQQRINKVLVGEEA
mgnify:CR=1 FL=1